MQGFDPQPSGPEEALPLEVFRALDETAKPIGCAPGQSEKDISDDSESLLRQSHGHLHVRQYRHYCDLFARPKNRKQLFVLSSEKQSTWNKNKNQPTKAAKNIKKLRPAYHRGPFGSLGLSCPCVVRHAKTEVEMIDDRSPSNPSTE